MCESFESFTQMTVFMSESLNYSLNQLERHSFSQKQNQLNTTVLIRDAVDTLLRKISLFKCAISILLLN